MINQAELERCNSKLFVYDVTQRGWEQEPNGFKANIQHTLTHLGKDVYQKDFTDPEKAQFAIAPDNLMYALRVARWGNVLPKQIVSSDTSAKISTDRRLDYFNSLPEPVISQLAAIDAVADLIHEEDHIKSREKALGERFNKVLYASRLLLLGVNQQIEKFDFNIEDSFDYRLDFLRRKFNIPQPE